MMNVRPLIYTYTDYRAYLKALYDFEKAHGEFSYSTFAQRAGFKARSFLRTVITGKRNLSPDAISKVVIGFGLSFPEGEAFKTLVNFNQAADFQARKHYWESFLKMSPKLETGRTVSDDYLYLARFAYPILLIILRQPHVKKDIESLSLMTGLKPHDVQEGLKTLEKLGAIREVEPQKYIVTADGFTTSNDTPSVARQTFHNNMLEKAKEALELPASQREYQSMMVPLTSEEFLYLRQRMRALVQEVEMKFGGKRPNSEKAYALNLNLIPITPEFIRESEKDLASQKSGDLENLEVLP